MHGFDLTVTLYPPDNDTATHAAIITAVDLVAAVVAEVHPDPTGQPTLEQPGDAVHPGEQLVEVLAGVSGGVLVARNWP